MNEVQVWEERVVIPTYGIGAPEKNPIFLEKRVYQGSSGVVYPHPVVEKILDVKEDKSYQAVFLENEFIKVMVLPELGGRIQMAYDKVANRHFIYYNQVIKPALVGLTGPWISGGIEFNWPQHHRPSTFQPIDYTITENTDGSKTVWVNEVERMFRTKGMTGFTLYPGKAFLEVHGRVYNRTPFPQTFLWWANPAVKVNDHYQSVFPPDVHAVFDHGRRDVSSFPIAKGVYYKVDYSPGTDISRYKNIPVPTSYMAVKSEYNFIGGYEHDARAGMVHVADHHISPGKKQWTWGHGAFGQAWDRNLTDEDGPYIELMTGVYTDNQPDFSWIQPFEEKTFSQYFMPYREVGLIKNASRDLILGLEHTDNTATIKAHATCKLNNLLLELVSPLDEVIFSAQTDLSVEEVFVRTVPIPATLQSAVIRLRVSDVEKQKLLLECRSRDEKEEEVPLPAMAILHPSAIDSTEQLYLSGLHLEQYRHATFVASDYYEEALKREPKDARNNNALGLWHLRRGNAKLAEQYFRTAIHTLTERNPNPYDGEAYYNLGWSLMLQDRAEAAFEAFYKSVWNDAWQHAGYLNLARLAAIRKDDEAALDFINRSILRNYHSHTARHLKVALLRRMDRYTEALALLEDSLELDPFNFGCLFEHYLIKKKSGDADAMATLTLLVTRARNWEHNYIEYALDYAYAGFMDEAVALLEVYLSGVDEPYNLVYYYLGWFSRKNNDPENARQYYSKARSMDVAYCFPNRVEEMLILQDAIRDTPEDAKAYYLLGNYWYDKREYKEAIACWEASAAFQPEFPTVHRNLSLAYYNKKQDGEGALREMELAFRLDPTDARVLMELDQLYKRMNISHQKRLELLNTYPDLVFSRDDLYLERIALYNHLEAYEQAAELLADFKFHPWEGGEGKVVNQYLMCFTELAKKSLQSGNNEAALILLTRAENYPENLGEGKLYGAQENDIFYWKGIAYERSGDTEKAMKYFRKATEGISAPVQAIFYNDPQPDKILYQALSWLKLGDTEKAQTILSNLIDFGLKHINDKISIDYFAVSLPDLLVFDADLNLRNRLHCIYLQGLGYLGLEAYETAEQCFNEVLSADRNHSGAFVHRNMLRTLLQKVQ